MEDEGGQGLRLHEIVDNIIGIIFASRDTTASVLTWVIKFLKTSPDALLDSITVKLSLPLSCQVTQFLLSSLILNGRHFFDVKQTAMPPNMNLIHRLCVLLCHLSHTLVDCSRYDHIAPYFPYYFSHDLIRLTSFAQ